MAVGLQLTLAGALLLSKAIQGKELHFTRGAFGNAKNNGEIITPTPEQMDNLSALINQKMSLPIVGYEFREGGDIAVTVRVKNENVTSFFRIREIGLFAKDPDTQQEILYGYYFDSVGDAMHAKNSYVTLEYYVELITTIANATNVTCNVVVVDKIKPGIGLSRNVDTINANLGDGITVDADNKLTVPKYVLPTGSTTVKGGFKVGKNLYLTGDSLNADDYILPTGNATLKGGFKVGKNLYLTGDSLNSDALGVLGKFNRISRIVGAGARNDGNASCHVFDREFNCSFVFDVSHGSRFARCACDTNRVGQVVNLIVNHLAEFGKVNARRVEGGNNRDARAFKWNFFHVKTSKNFLIGCLFDFAENFSVLLNDLFVAEDAQAVLIHAVANQFR